MIKIPLIDLTAQFASIREDVVQAVETVLSSGTYILGPQVAAFEEEMADFLGVKYAVGVSSGTDALILSLRALEVGQGDEVIVPAYTFFATAEAVSHVGATPVFVDIDPDTYCLDPTELTRRITRRTRAIIPVHLFGHPADLDPVMAIAKREGLSVIEDAAQAVGAMYRGRKVGSLGDAGCLSFFPTKNLGGCGDGGMVVTNKAAVYEQVRKLRTHGWRTKFAPETIGYNSRLDELQAAILRVKFRQLSRWNARRREIASRYRRLLSGSAARIPSEASYAHHVYHLYLIRVDARDAVQNHLNRVGIMTGVYYPSALHDLWPYRQLTKESEEFPEARSAARETLAIPLYPEMTEDQIFAVADGVKHALQLTHSSH